MISCEYISEIEFIIDVWAVVYHFDGDDDGDLSYSSVYCKPASATQSCTMASMSVSGALQVHER